MPKHTCNLFWDTLEAIGGVWDAIWDNPLSAAVATVAIGCGVFACIVYWT